MVTESDHNALNIFTAMSFALGEVATISVLTGLSCVASSRRGAASNPGKLAGQKGPVIVGKGLAGQRGGRGRPNASGIADVDQAVQVVGQLDPETQREAILFLGHGRDPGDNRYWSGLGGGSGGVSWSKRLRFGREWLTTNRVSASAGWRNCATSAGRSFMSLLRIGVNVCGNQWTKKNRKNEQAVPTTRPQETAGLGRLPPQHAP